jgi:hypothetical protein
VVAQLAAALRYKLEGRGFDSPIPVAERSKARFCVRSLAGIAGSIPAGGMVICGVCCTVQRAETKTIKTNKYG